MIPMVLPLKPLRLGLDTANGTFVGSFNPISLFAGAGGVFYNLTDPATLFSDAARTVPALPGVQVAGVTDLSGNGNHLVGTTPGIIRDVDAVGNVCVFFPGAGSTGLSDTGVTLGSASGYTVACAFACTSGVAMQQAIMDSHSTGASIGQLAGVSTGCYTIAFNTVPNSFTLNPVIPGRVLSTETDVKVIGVLRRPLDVFIRLNGVPISSRTTTGTPNSSAAARIALGASYAGGATPNVTPLTGRIYTAFMINRQLTEGELWSLESWMMAQAT